MTTPNEPRKPESVPEPVPKPVPSGPPDVPGGPPSPGSVPEPAPEPVPATRLQVPGSAPEAEPEKPAPSGPAGALAYVLAVVGAFLIVAVLVWAMQHYTQPPALNATRAAERAKALAELRAAEAQAMTTTAWLNQTNGIVRLRVEDAVKIVERDWGANPAAARSNLLVRVQKAFPAPPPKPPEKPSPFE